VFAVTKLSFVAANCSYDCGPTQLNSESTPATATEKGRMRFMPESSEALRTAARWVFNRKMLINCGFFRTFAA
jgi:hypothetical protein